MKIEKIFIIISLLLIPIYIRSDNSNIVHISVAYLEDKRVPSISNKDIKKIISSAKDELYIKFGTKNIIFDYKGKKNIKSFFKKYLKKNSKFYKNLAIYKLNLRKNHIDYEQFKPEIIKFLKQWKLWDLKDFFPPDIKSKISSYDDIVYYLFKIYEKKVNILKNLKFKGRFIIDKSKDSVNSYINWLTVMYFQNRYDIVFSNTLIVYDNIVAPYPHAVLRYAKVGGSSFESPKRKIFDGTSSMVNLFEMLTPLKYFKSKKIDYSLSREKWDDIIGRFIMAHEMGHMIYLIPDVYDHPKGCLMDSSYMNMDYYEGYKILLKYPFQCPKCKVWVDARNTHFYADSLFNKKNYKDAIFYYKKAIKQTPRKLDIDYNKYISLLYYKISLSFYKLNDINNAKKYLKKSLSLFPENKKSNYLKELINEK